MFSKNKHVSKVGGTQIHKKPSIPSIVSADLTIDGDLSCEGELQVDGIVNGDIKTTTLLIGEAAKIKGEIRAKRIRVYGRVDGNITAQSVTLAKTAHVYGDVVHEDLSIEKGAFLEGHCKRVNEAKIEEVTNVPKVELGNDVSRPPVPQKSLPNVKDKPKITKPDTPSNSTEKSAIA